MILPIYYTRFDSALPLEKWNFLMKSLPEEIQNKINRYQFWQDRHRSLFGKLLLQTALTGVGSNKGLSHLQYDANGRPWIDDCFDFNISHSGSYVICALSDRCKLGVDVAEIKKIDFGDFSKVMTPEQWKLIRQSEDPLAFFYKLWTLKESVIKANGKGLSIPLDQLETDFKTVQVENKIWFVNPLHFDKMHCGYAATDIPNFEPVLIEQVY